MRVCAALLLLVGPSAAFADAVYVAKPRSVGHRVPESLGIDLQEKLAAALRSEHRLVLEGKIDPAMERGSTVDRAALLEQVASARQAHEELDSEGARATLKSVLDTIGGLPSNAEAREVWVAAQMLTIELGEAEQDLPARDAAIEELLRVVPRFSPSKNGMNSGLADLVLARKASLPRAGRLRVLVRPAEAELFVDGSSVGARSSVRPGKHRLLARMKGFRAHEEVFEVSHRGGVKELRVQLRRARAPKIKGLAGELRGDGAEERARVAVSDAVRRSSSSFGLLATIGRRSDSRFNIHVAVYKANGTPVGAAKMVSGALIDSVELAAVVKAAMGGRSAAPIAMGDWSKSRLAKADKRETGGYAGLTSGRRRGPSRRAAPRSIWRSPHFWVVSTIIVAGGTASALVYAMQEAPIREVQLEPTMGIEVNLP